MVYFLPDIKQEWCVTSQVILNCRQAVVSWTTANQTANPIVQYGIFSGSYTQNVTAVYDNYTRFDMCGAIANSTGWTDPGADSPYTLSSYEESCPWISGMWYAPWKPEDPNPWANKIPMQIEMAPTTQTGRMLLIVLLCLYPNSFLIPVLHPKQDETESNVYVLQEPSTMPSWRIWQPTLDTFYVVGDPVSFCIDGLPWCDVCMTHLHLNFFFVGCNTRICLQPGKESHQAPQKASLKCDKISIMRRQTESARSSASWRLLHLE